MKIHEIASELLDEIFENASNEKIGRLGWFSKIVKHPELKLETMELIIDIENIEKFYETRLSDDECQELSELLATNKDRTVDFVRHFQITSFFEGEIKRGLHIFLEPKSLEKGSSTISMAMVCEWKESDAIRF